MGLPLCYRTGKQAAAFHYGLNVGTGALVGGIGALALQMLLDKDLRAQFTDRTPSAPIHPQVIRDAAVIAPLLKHLDPQKSRVAIGGLPGTGKSELAATLAKQLCMQHHDADLGMGMRPIPPGSVAERYDMLVNQDPEQFDALLHLQRPGVSRGSAMGEMVDLPAVDKANQHQFAAAKGEMLHPTDTAWLKLKPPGGFGTKDLDQPFINKGYAAKKLAPGAAGVLAGAILAHVLQR